MNKYKVVLAYDGSEFKGWQAQPGLRTVQGVLSAALKRIAKKDIEVVGSGRTDTKVHALGQVFHFESDIKMPCESWKDAMNSLLPDDVNIISVKKIKEEFHARFHATDKYYQYHLNTGTINIFERNHVLQYCRPLDIKAMQGVLHTFQGTHDFTSLNATELAIISNQVRTITKIELEVIDDHLIFHIVGSGFLRYMVRMLVALIVEVGKNKLTQEDCQAILEAKNKNAFTKNIGAQGLYLVAVTYPDEYQ